MKPINNIVYQMQYLVVICFMLDLQENIYKTVREACYMLANFAGRHVVDFEDLSIDVFLEVQNKKHT